MSKTTQLSPICPKFLPVQGRPNSNGIKFSLVSYNILAKVYVHRHLFPHSSFFPHSPPPCLEWPARSQAILTIIQSLGADFLCLQELDEYDNFYKKNTEIHGYSSVYIQRSGHKRDGCGIFYKRNCADLLLEERIDYNDLANLNEGSTSESGPGGRGHGHGQGRGDPNDPRVRYKRDCVGVMAAFKLKDPSHHIVIVANTHLYWDPQCIGVKLAQAGYLLSRLVSFRTLVLDRFECSPSVILAGDFNSTPGDKVYQYLVSGNSSSSTNPVERFNEPPVRLHSLYGHLRGEPPFTTCTPHFTNTLDYIFFSPDDCIKPVSFLELPEVNSPHVLGGLPNYYHPSDHIPIGAEFEITRKKSLPVSCWKKWKINCFSFGGISK